MNGKEHGRCQMVGTLFLITNCEAQQVTVHFWVVSEETEANRVMDCVFASRKLMHPDWEEIRYCPRKRRRTDSWEISQADYSFTGPIVRGNGGKPSHGVRFLREESTRKSHISEKVHSLLDLVCQDRMLVAGQYCRGAGLLGHVLLAVSTSGFYPVCTHVHRRIGGVEQQTVYNHSLLA